MAAASLEEVRREARACRACPLWEINTQTVFGEGPADADVMFLGEAPGAQEDRAGSPFVGPAGKLFDEALAQAGIERSRVYVTNVVKHRPWVQTPSGRGKNRPPKTSEIKACRPWLEAELERLRPRIVVCLGAVAGRAVLGKDFKLTPARGKWTTADFGAEVMPTVHPSFVLIQPPDAGDRWRELFFEDFRTVAERMASLAGGRELRAAV